MSEEIKVSKALEESPADVASMEDFEKEINESFKRVYEGDIVTGTVLSVDEEEVIVELDFYAPGKILKADFSENPNLILEEEVTKGMKITAMVIKTDDGTGHILLSKQKASDELSWDYLKKQKAEKNILAVKISEVTNGGVITYVEGIRGFIPASKLALQYVEDLSVYKGKTVEARVITIDEEHKKLVLSCKEILYDKKQQALEESLESLHVGDKITGIVESLKEYGAFVAFGDGFTGLVHISKISEKRIKKPSEVLKEGDEISATIIKIADKKISLSMVEDVPVDEEREAVEYHDQSVDAKGEGQTGMGTGLGDLLSGFKF